MDITRSPHAIELSFNGIKGASLLHGMRVGILFDRDRNLLISDRIKCVSMVYPWSQISNGMDGCDREYVVENKVSCLNFYMPLTLCHWQICLPRPISPSQLLIRPKKPTDKLFVRIILIWTLSLPTNPRIESDDCLCCHGTWSEVSSQDSCLSHRFISISICYTIEFHSPILEILRHPTSLVRRVHCSYIWPPRSAADHGYSLLN